jgi:hypothetical protein
MSETLTGRLREFYRQSPHEYLTYDDIAKKLDCTETQARQAVRCLRNSGDVECEYVIFKRPGAKI